MIYQTFFFTCKRLRSVDWY